MKSFQHYRCILAVNMKWIVLTVLLCAVALEAIPYGIGLGGLGLGHGLGSMSHSHSGYANGDKFGGQEYNSGANGVDNQEHHNMGGSNFHDQGHHHKKVTSINTAEETDDHDVGGSDTYDNGAHSNSGYNNYQNGASGYGNNYDEGMQDQENIYG